MTAARPCRLISLLSLSALFLLAASTAVATDGSALMRESDRRLRAEDESARYRMELFSGDALITTRTLERYQKKLPDRFSTLVRFTSPVAVRGAAMLIEDHGSTQNDIWSYVPATHTLRRIPGSQKQNWFMGTEFTYEDFEDYKLSSYRFTEAETVAPCLVWAVCHVVDAVPSQVEEQRASGYSRKRYYLEKASLFPVQIEYFDATGRLVKRLTTEGLHRIGNYMRATGITMSNLVADRHTRMVVLYISTSHSLDANLFTQRQLRSEGD